MEGLERIPSNGGSRLHKTGPPFEIRTQKPADVQEVERLPCPVDRLEFRLHLKRPHVAHRTAETWFAKLVGFNLARHLVRTRIRSRLSRKPCVRPFEHGVEVQDIRSTVPKAFKNAVVGLATCLA